MNLAVLLPLLAISASAAEDYSLRLRFERGTETRLFDTNVELGRGYNTVWASSGAASEHMIVNLMPVGSSDGRRAELMYQVEWAIAGRILQAQDSAVVSEREEALLSEVAGSWKLWGRIARNGAGDSCTPPPSGGGLRARLRLLRAGVEHSVVRRTESGIRSNLVSDEGPGRVLNLSLLPELAPDGASAAVRYAVELSTQPLLEWDGPGKSAKVPLGAETLVEGDGNPDGVWITLETVPIVSPAAPVVLEVPDARTGWLRHAGATLSFLHPKDWLVRPSCGPDLQTNGWNVVDLTLPKAARMGQQLMMFTVRGDDTPLGEKTVTVGGGACSIWRTTGPDHLAHASCRSNAGLRLEAHLALEPKGTARFDTFKRLVESLVFEHPLP